jgi:hypothetical protein
MIVANNKINSNKKYTSNSGDFDGHTDIGYGDAMRGASPNGKHIRGFMQSH